MNEKYSYEIKPELNDALKKIAKKNKQLFDAAMKKILQLTEKPELGKSLKYTLKGVKRVHIGHFVLMYEIDYKLHKLSFLKLEHHDKAYK